MKNPYKRIDVFTCHYAQHARFAHRVSAFHVLVEKKCYPQGCLMYRYTCALFNKGKRCSRGFTRMGRLCPGCAHYRDEKIHQQPTLRLSPAEDARFREQCHDFDEWIMAYQGREWDITFTIGAVKPRFLKVLNPHGGQLRLDGYLLIARRGFIGRESIEDAFYAAITPQQQERFALAPGDRLDARGILAFDRGRILFPKIGAVELGDRSGRPTWSNSQALVAKTTARSLPQQPHKCLKCPQGALVDVIQRDGRSTTRRRELVCLQGIKEEHDCYFTTLQQLEQRDLFCAGRVFD